jgi:hypothetical protein
MDLDGHALELGSDLGRDHHDLSPGLQELAGLPVGDLTATDDHAPPPAEVQKYGIKDSVLALDLSLLNYVSIRNRLEGSV